MSTNPTYSIVVPVYESSTSVVQLTGELAALFNRRKDTVEILLIDDGSKSEATRLALDQLALEYPEVRTIRLRRNFGKAGAILCGFQFARGQWILTIDDDLQQSPADIPKLLELRHHDVVVGTFDRKHHHLAARLGSRIKRWFDRSILRLPCPMSPLKLIKATVVRSALRIQTPHPFIPALLAYVTSDFVAVPLTHYPSAHGRSRYSIRARLRQVSNLVINNSSILLRWTGVVGVLASIAAVLYASFIVLRKLQGDQIQAGWPSLIVIHLSLGGLILIVLSLIGEYLIRILEGTTSRPPFILRDDSWDAESDPNPEEMR